MWDDEDPESPDTDDDGDETVPCPYCREPVYEDAEQCPSCGEYLTREDAPWRRPVWLVAGVVVGLILVLTWTLS